MPDRQSLWMERHYRLWCGLWIPLFIFGFPLTILNLWFATHCLYKFRRSTTSCVLAPANRTSLLDHIARSAFETAEPMVSIFLVILVMVFTHMSSSKARAFERAVLKNPKILTKKMWFMAYAVSILVACSYHILVIVTDLERNWAGVVRYIALPIALFSWSIWMIMLNEVGPTTLTDYKLAGKAAFPRLSILYKTTIIYAAIANGTEVFVYSVYIAASISLVTEANEDRIIWLWQFLGMSTVAALRYQLTGFFIQMLYIGNRRYKVITDPWDEEFASDDGDTATNGLILNKCYSCPQLSSSKSIADWWKTTIIADDMSMPSDVLLLSERKRHIVQRVDASERESGQTPNTLSINIPSEENISTETEV